MHDAPASEPVRLPSVAGTPLSPPAIWTAMARQGQWKSWALVLAFSLCALEGLVVLKLARKEPDIVLIAPDGKSTYLSPSVAGDALVRFLEEQRQRPSDVTVVHFTRDFFQHFFAVDAGGYQASFRAALDMLSPSLRERIAREAASSQLLEAVRASHARATVTVEALDLVERTEDALHLRGMLLRRTESLEAGALLSLERLRVDLYESIVPRSAGHPDGLVVGQFTSRVERVDSPATPPPPEEASAHAP
jgi:hypothetical protein